MVFVTAIVSSFGCSTAYLLSESSEESDRNTSRNNNNFYQQPVLTDDIIAIAHPDAALSKTMGQPNVVAFLGKMNSYVLFKGGDELEYVSQLHLDGTNMDVDAISHNLYLKDKQVWGDLVLTYGYEKEITVEEQTELEEAGFNAEYLDKTKIYRKKIKIEGVIYPAFNLSDEQRSKLTTSRPFLLFNPRDAKPPLTTPTPTFTAETLLVLPITIAEDVVLAPIELGVGVSVLMIGAAEKLKTSNGAASHDSACGNPPALSAPNAEALMRAKNCMACHSISQQAVGPSFMNIAKRYQSDSNALTTLEQSILVGSKDVWGRLPMPAMSNVSREEACVLATWILSLEKIS